MNRIDVITESLWLATGIAPASACQKKVNTKPYKQLTEQLCHTKYCKDQLLLRQPVEYVNVRN